MVPYPRADFTIFLRLSDDERRRRIIERDTVWKKTVIDYWELHQLTLADVLHRQPTFDLELDGMCSPQENTEKIMVVIFQ